MERKASIPSSSMIGSNRERRVRDKADRRAHGWWKKQMKLTVDVCLRAPLARSLSVCQHDTERRLLYYTFNY